MVTLELPKDLINRLNCLASRAGCSRDELITELIAIGLDEMEGRARGLGFMAGQLRVPADFDRMADEEIIGLFGGPS